MTSFTSTLDRRFSNPDATATDWAETRRVLDTAELFWICTVSGGGRPHVTPLVAVWHDDKLHFCTGAGEQKALNLSSSRHVILMTGCNSWDRGLDVVLEGDAVRVRDTDTLRRLAEAWRTKWDGSWTFDVGEEGFQNPDTGDPVPVFAVAPRKVLAFRKGDFSHTSHRPQAAGSPGT